jgi:hypothetical protein
LIFGWLAWKSLITPSIDSASRSVKKCQNFTVPETSEPALAMPSFFVAGVHAAASSAAVAAAVSTVNARPGVRGRTEPRRRPVISIFLSGATDQG